MDKMNVAVLGLGIEGKNAVKALLIMDVMFTVLILIKTL